MPRPTRTWLRWWPAVALVTGQGLVGLAVSPFYEVPQNDEWAYYLVIETWFETGELPYLGWNDPTLLFQLFWGGTFARLFGLSYTTLRFSTLVLSCVGVLSLYGILRRVGSSREVSFFGAALLAFNPLYLLLGYSFNTDVPYLALATAAMLVFLVALEQQRISLLLAGGLLASFATLVRQPGLLVPLVVSAYVVWTWPGLWRRVAAVTSAVLPSVVALQLYGVWLHGQTQASWLETVSNLHPFFRDPTLAQLGSMLSASGLNAAAGLMSTGFFLLPLLIALLPAPFRGARRLYRTLLSLVVGIALLGVGGWALAGGQPEGLRGWPHQGNYLTRLGCLAQFPVALLAPTWVWRLLTFVTPVLGAWLFVSGLAAVSVRRNLSAVGPTLVFVASLAQFLPSFVQIEIYDRYLVALLPGVIVLALARVRPAPRVWIGAASALVLWAAVSVEYMRAYVDRAKAAWSLAETLVDAGVGPEALSLGFEWSGTHLYLEALELYGPERRFDFQKEWPWHSLTRHRYFFREFAEEPAEPFTRYRAFLGTSPRFIGFAPRAGRSRP